MLFNTGLQSLDIDECSSYFQKKLSADTKIAGLLDQS